MRADEARPDGDERFPCHRRSVIGAVAAEYRSKEVPLCVSASLDYAFHRRQDEVGRPGGRGHLRPREVLMSVYRRLAAVGAIAALGLVGAGSAFAATPQQIYRDLADNGRLDGVYTRADIERALNLAPVVRTDAFQPAPRKPIAVPAEEASSARAAGRSDRRVPFSALDAALLVAGGGPLLLIGAGLRRRFAEAPRRQASAASG
jgi:hypothetical protein